MNLSDTIGMVLKEKGQNIWSLGPEALVYQAIEMMANKHVGALLVISDGKRVGILSGREYARKVILQERSSKQTQETQIMASPVIVPRPDHTVKDCMRFMTDNRIRPLPAVDSA